MSPAILLAGMTHVVIRLSVAFAVWFLGVWVARYFFSYAIKGTGRYMLVMTILTLIFVFGRIFMNRQ